MWTHTSNRAFTLEGENRDRKENPGLRDPLQIAERSRRGAFATPVPEIALRVSSRLGDGLHEPWPVGAPVLLFGDFGPVFREHSRFGDGFRLRGGAKLVPYPMDRRGPAGARRGSPRLRAGRAWDGKGSYRNLF